MSTHVATPMAPAYLSIICCTVDELNQITRSLSSRHPVVVSIPPTTPENQPLRHTYGPSLLFKQLLHRRRIQPNNKVFIVAPPFSCLDTLHYPRKSSHSTTHTVPAYSSNHRYIIDEFIQTIRSFSSRPHIVVLILPTTQNIDPLRHTYGPSLLFKQLLHRRWIQPNNKIFSVAPPFCCFNAGMLKNIPACGRCQKTTNNHTCHYRVIVYL